MTERANTDRSAGPWPSVCLPRLRKVIKGVEYEEMKRQEVKKRIIHNGKFDQTEMQSLGAARTRETAGCWLSFERKLVGVWISVSFEMTDTWPLLPPIDQHPTVAQFRGSSRACERLHSPWSCMSSAVWKSKAAQARPRSGCPDYNFQPLCRLDTSHAVPSVYSVLSFSLSLSCLSECQQS
jgi:hypothetical protein